VIAIRKATVKDKETLINALFQIMADGFNLGYGSPMVASQENAALLYAITIHQGLVAGDPILIAEEDGAVVGVSITLIRRGPIAFVAPTAYGTGWWVEPAYRRKRVLSTLLEKTEQMLRSAHIAIWEEYIFEPNMISTRVALKRGFTGVLRAFQKKLIPQTH
jgi:GNAT superfamily N-acetyltransferase